MNIYKSTTEKSDRQVMQTPPGIAEWCAREYGCDVDLAASLENKKFHLYYSGVMPYGAWGSVPGIDLKGYSGNALLDTWHSPRNAGFCNPPYADLAPWLFKALGMASQRFTSVFLIPTFNGDKWGHYAYQATEIIFIEGRINFIKESDGKPLKGNGRGSMLCVFSPFQGAGPAVSYITLKEILGE